MCNCASQPQILFSALKQHSDPSPDCIVRNQGWDQQALKLSAFEDPYSLALCASIDCLLTMTSCGVISAIVCVLITTVAVIVAFATPNWVKFENLPVLNQPDTLCQCSNCECGLWLHCLGGFTDDGSIDNCNWFFSEDFRIEKTLPAWFKAVQGLMSCAVATSLLSLMIGLFSLCCYCKSCSAHQAAGAFINLTFLLVAVAVCVFGAKSHLDYDIEVEVNDDSQRVSIFGWSFWVAVGAGGMALISSIIYICVGRNDEYV